MYCKRWGAQFSTKEASFWPIIAVLFIEGVDGAEICSFFFHLLFWRRLLPYVQTRYVLYSE